MKMIHQGKQDEMNSRGGHGGYNRNMHHGGRPGMTSGASGPLSAAANTLKNPILANALPANYVCYRCR